MNLSSRHLLLLFALLLALGLAGCRSMPRWGNRPTPAPPTFNEPPPLDTLIGHITANSAKVRQLQASGANISVPGTMTPSLRADLTLETPRRMRLIGGTGLSGTEIDLGSNDELFWVWIKRSDPPAVYYARHEQIHQSGMAARLPLDPQWLFDALGLMTFDPADYHEGPYSRPDGRLEIRTTRTTAGRQYTRLTIIDPQYGWVLEQHMYDERKALVATATASQHALDPTSGATLPHKVELYMPMDDMRIRIEINAWRVNQLTGDPTQLWTLPVWDNYQYIDLGAPGLLGPQAPLDRTSLQVDPAPATRTAATPYDALGTEPVYRQSTLPTPSTMEGVRGYTERR